jgi:chitin disaccharide deacetylase
MENKYFIVHADDFGLSPGISEGIIKTIENGIVSSTSVIVESKYLSVSKKIILNRPNFDWGLHVLILHKNPSSKIILKETKRQINIFKNSFGFPPSHIDFHKGFKFDTKTYFEILMFSLKNNFAFRYDRQHHIEIDFYGIKKNRTKYDAIETKSIMTIIENLPNGITELVCHPGLTSNRLKDPYRLHRKKELLTLIDPQLKLKLKKEKIKLINFEEYKKITKKNEK